MASPNISDVIISLVDAMDMPQTTGPKQQGLVSDELRIKMQWLLYGILATAISSFGIVSNIINIICFVRQGLKDPVNVSLLGLAISDLGKLVMSLCIATGYSPALQYLALPVEIVDFLYITVAPLYYLFTGLTSWVTALITLERCLCITVPMKVKRMITPKRVTVIILSIFIFLAATSSPVYCAGKLSWIFSPARNGTILKLEYTEYRETIEQFYYSVNNGIIPFSAYFTIITCTCILVGKLRNKAKWRKTCSSVKDSDKISKRDQRVAKMVMMISILFIVCFTPICLSVISMIVVPELALDGPNLNLLFIYGGVSMVLESGNSSANIFIYYHMSSRYRSVFKDMFRFGKVSIEQQNFMPEM